MRTVEKRWEMSSAILPGGEFGEALEDIMLGSRIERGCRLVKDQQLRVAQIGTRESHFLPLAAR